MTRRQHASRALETLMTSRAHLFGAVLNQRRSAAQQVLLLSLLRLQEPRAITPHPRPDRRRRALRVDPRRDDRVVDLRRGRRLRVGGRAADDCGARARGRWPPSSRRITRYPNPRSPADSRAVAATALQLVPLPPSLRAVLSPHADAVRSALVLGETGAGRVAADIDRPAGDGLIRSVS